MLISFCKSKIAHATITEAELYYEGSITVDETLLKAVDILPGEKVEVLNLYNGARLETYAIAGKAGSGQICLNGPAARAGPLTFALVAGAAAGQHRRRCQHKQQKDHFPG